LKVVDQHLLRIFSDKSQFQSPDACSKIGGSATHKAYKIVVSYDIVPIILDSTPKNTANKAKELIACFKVQFFSCFLEFVETIESGFNRTTIDDWDL
jgi:hypothetical protein